jgi:hypothetical protein
MIELIWDVFRQLGRCHRGQPIEDLFPHQSANAAVRVEVGVGDFLGMKPQQPIRPANIRGGITPAGIRPID